MKNRILVIITLLLILVGFSNCRMHQERPPKYYFQAYRTHRHWGKESHVNVKHMYWGHRRSGPRVYHNRGHFRIF
jgi:hypothetical protein